MLIIGLSGAVFAGKPVRRNVAKDANGNFSWSCFEFEDIIEINCYADNTCQICPQSVGPGCRQLGAYDPTDLLAMEEMYGEADNMVAQEQESGELYKTYWVESEQYPRSYRVTWHLSGDQYIMDWMRVEE